jgi:uncharacterized iron-regulated membrane protein
MGIVGDRLGLQVSVYLVPACFLVLGLLILGDYIYGRKKKAAG